jgi:hypothetical protein
MEDLETSRRRRDVGQIQPTKIITASGLFESGFKERPGPLLERPGRFLPPGQLRGALRRRNHNSCHCHLFPSRLSGLFLENASGRYRPTSD